MNPLRSIDHDSDFATPRRDFLISDATLCGDSIVAFAGVWEDMGDMFAGRVVMSRSEILARLDAGDGFRTLVRNVRGDWKKGPRIAVERIAGSRFLKANDDADARDSLGRLPSTWPRNPRQQERARTA